MEGAERLVTVVGTATLGYPDTGTQGGAGLRQEERAAGANTCGVATMDKDEVVPPVQRPCTFCGTLTFNTPNFDDSIACGLRCTEEWLDGIIKQERVSWDDMKEEIRALILMAKAQSGENGSH